MRTWGKPRPFMPHETNIVSAHGVSEVEALQSGVVHIGQPENLSSAEFIGELINRIEEVGTKPEPTQPLTRLGGS